MVVRSYELGAKVAAPARRLAFDVATRTSSSTASLRRATTSGNRLVGIPKSDLYAELAYRPAFGFFAAFEVKAGVSVRY